MQFVVLLLLVVALALLVLGLVSTSTPLVIASIVVSLVAVYAAVRARGMRDARLARKATEKTQADKAQADRVAADKAGTERAVTAAKSVPASAAVAPPSTAVPSKADPSKAVPSRAEAARAEPVDGPAAADDLDNAAFGYVGADLAVESLHLPVAEAAPAPESPVPAEPPVAIHSPARHALAEDVTTVLPPVPVVEPKPVAAESDEPPAATTTPPLDISADERVWVVDGRPRYHWKSCAFLAFRESEPITLKQAVEDGFTPCSLCDPDTRLAF